jgi:hypothetical protein
MSECKIDHTQEEVKAKYRSQEEFLPKEMIPQFQQFFSKDHSQDLLNELFHLLKKYDLASAEEQEARNNRLKLIFKNV